MSALLEVRELRVSFRARGSRSRVVAVDGVDLTLERGRTVGIVGESGAGKSTLARAVLGLIPADAGSVTFAGQATASLDRAGRRRLRRRAQLVFQDPVGSLNPRMTTGRTIIEALRVHGVPAGRAPDRARQLLDVVGLPGNVLGAHPHQLSGGQLQRVGIARALAVEPDLLVLDEPVSALDVSVQAQIVNLLLLLQEQMALSYLFISHDLALVHRLSDHLMVMKKGRVVEEGPPDVVVRQPVDPYTRTLVRASLPGLPEGPGEGSKPGSGTLDPDP